MITAGRIIAPYGGQFQLQPDKRDLGEPEYFYADTRDELRKAIRENIHFGATVIKIVVDDQRYVYSVDDIRYVIEEAEKTGLRVAAHAWSDVGTRNAVEAGVASIEHGNEISEDTMRLAKENNVMLVGTDFPEEAFRQMGLPEDMARERHQTSIDRLKKAHTIGMPIAFGTDVIYSMDGEDRGTLSLSFIDSFVEASIPPRDILRSMTTNAAELLGVEEERGAVREGLFADIIATPQNPLDNIHTLKEVAFVMKNGEVFKTPQ